VDHLTSEPTCVVCHQPITSERPGTWGVAVSNAMHLECQPPSKPLFLPRYSAFGKELEPTEPDARAYFTRYDVARDEIERLRAQVAERGLEIEYLRTRKQERAADETAAAPRRPKYLREIPLDAQCERCRMSPLYAFGDCILVWVNEGDAYALMDDVTASKTSALCIHGKPLESLDCAPCMLERNVGNK
jgi:hypothetical protein